MNFQEKPEGDGSYINGGFFILRKKIFDYLPDGTDLVFEQGPLKNLAKDGELQAYFHGGFWQCMDSLRDKQLLENIWVEKSAPWKR